MKGQVATLIVPSDIQGAECAVEHICSIKPEKAAINDASIQKAVEVLRVDQKTALILGGRALRKRGLSAAARIKAATGCDILSERAPARIEKGAGIPPTELIPYFPSQALELLSKYRAVVLAGADEPVTFFGWTGYPSRLLSKSAHICRIVADGDNLSQALSQLADALGAPLEFPASDRDDRKIEKPRLPKGDLTAERACRILALLQPENAIVVNESISTGGAYLSLGKGALPHTMMALPGGSIGYGVPCSVGAAIACPERPVINFQADGSAMYTLQALWMQAREGLNVTTLICANRSYQILNVELKRAGINTPSRHLRRLTALSDPDINWVNLSQGLGVPAVAVENCENMVIALRRALAEQGPHLIELQLG